MVNSKSESARWWHSGENGRFPEIIVPPRDHFKVLRSVRKRIASLRYRAVHLHLYNFLPDKFTRLKYVTGVQITSTIRSPCGFGLCSIQWNMIVCSRNNASQCRWPTSLEQWPQYWDNSHMQCLRILPVPLAQLSQAIFTDDADIIVIMVPDNARRQYP